ncbi:MAG: flippase [Candidatus Aenigmarchaeota archaeon]|nr:flippase [Candidatus Aenigmarchaeota archaeon]
MGYDVIAAVLGYSIGIVSSAFVALYFVHRKLLSLSGKWSFDKKIAASILSYSWPLALSAFLLSVVIQLDTIMLGHFLSERDVGLYNAALPTAQIVIMVPAALGSLLLSTMTALYTSGKKKETESIYKSVTKWLFAFTVPITLLLVMFSREIMLVFFGIDYIDGSLPLRILAVGIMVSGVFYPSNDIINMLKKTKTQLYAAASSLAITVALNYILIPKFGLSGAAAATSFSLIFLSLFLLFFSHRYSGLNPFVKSIAKPFVACAIPAMAIYLAKGRVAGALSLPLMVPFLIAYFLSLKAMHFFSAEDRMIFDAVKRKLSGG